MEIELHVFLQLELVEKELRALGIAWTGGWVAHQSRYLRCGEEEDLFSRPISLTTPTHGREVVLLYYNPSKPRNSSA
jgi:hypothetical protein